MTRRQRLHEISALAVLVVVVAGPATAQEALPDIEVGAPRKAVHVSTNTTAPVKPKPKPAPKPVPVAAAPRQNP